MRTGNALPLKAIPTGTLVHNIEMKVGKGGQLVRSAGGGAEVLAKEDRYTRSGCRRVRSGVCSVSAWRPSGR